MGDGFTGHNKRRIRMRIRSGVNKRGERDQGRCRAKAGVARGRGYPGEWVRRRDPCVPE